MRSLHYKATIPIALFVNPTYCIFIKAGGQIVKVPGSLTTLPASYLQHTYLTESLIIILLAKRTTPWPLLPLRPKSVMAWQRFWVSRSCTVIRPARIISREANLSTLSPRPIPSWRRSLLHGNGFSQSLQLAKLLSIGPGICFHSSTGSIVTMCSGSLGI